MELDVVTREQWRAKAEIRECPDLISPVTFVFTSLDTDSCTCQDDDECHNLVYNFQKLDMYMEELPDIRYNFLIANTGKIYECRGWQKSPNLPDRLKDYNPNAIYIAFIGPPCMDLEDGVVTEEMKDAQERILEYGVARGLIRNMFLHFTLTREEPQKDMFYG